VLFEGGGLPQVKQGSETCEGEEAALLLKHLHASRLGVGRTRPRLGGCDAHYEYVKINAEYTTWMRMVAIRRRTAHLIMFGGGAPEGVGDLERFARTLPRSSDRASAPSSFTGVDRRYPGDGAPRASRS
jgi:hypothetical protein